MLLHNHWILNFRDFINKHYVQIKQGNPKTPILIRECSGVQPRLWARYGMYVIQNRNLLFLIEPIMSRYG